MRNSEVIKAWINGTYAQSEHLKTDSYNLWSYKLLIGTRENRVPVVFDYTAGGGAFVSATTSKHVGLARRAAGQVRPPK